MIKGTRSDDSKGLTFPKCPWSPDGHLDCKRYYMVLQSKLCIDVHCCMSPNHMKTRSNIGPIGASQVEWFCCLQFKPRCSPWSLASAMIVFSLAPSLSRASRSSWGTARFENPQSVESVPASHHNMLPWLSWHNLFFWIHPTLRYYSKDMLCHYVEPACIWVEPAFILQMCKQASNKTSIPYTSKNQSEVPKDLSTSRLLNLAINLLQQHSIPWRKLGNIEWTLMFRSNYREHTSNNLNWDENNHQNPSQNNSVSQSFRDFANSCLISQSPSQWTYHTSLGQSHSCSFGRQLSIVYKYV